MMAWVVVIIACNSPVAVTCQSLVNPEIFFSEQKCLEAAENALGYLGKQGVLSTGNCYAVDIGKRT